MDKFKPTLKQKALKIATARDFSGGLNYNDSEFNLASRYAVAGYNMVPDDNGSLQVRFGTRLLANTGVQSRIVAMEYFYRYIIAVHENGQISAIDASGAVTSVWNAIIAATLAGNPSGWGTTTQANFTQFLGQLIITNGTDKPIALSIDLAVQYLQDLGTGTNINTPIAKYVITHSNYVVMAGDPEAPGRLYISNAGTSGTWPNDPLPNDAITFDVYKYTGDSMGEITGLASFRDRLVVFFSEYVVTVKLGSYNTATPPVHTPTVDDIVESYGATSHRSIVNTGDTLMFLDYTGVSQAKQATFTQTLTPTRVSTLIDNQLQRAMTTLPRATLQQGAYALYDRRESRILWFLPPNADTDPGQLMRVFVLNKFASKLAWSEYTNWNFQAGCISTEGRIFLASSNNVYRHGSTSEPILSDYEGVQAYNGVAQDKHSVYVNGVYCDQSTLAIGIPFYYELPQNILGERTQWKNFHYITMDTQGASRFTVSMYLDDLKKRMQVSGSAWTDGNNFSDLTTWQDAYQPSTPYASMLFVGGDRGAYGVPVTLYIDGYRPTDNMGLYAIYGRFRFFKMALSGTSYSHLRIVSVSLYYTAGGIY